MSENTTVQVALRIRPLIESEISKGCEDILEVFSDLNQVRVKNSDKAFSYNYVFNSNVTQEDFYKKSVKGMIQNLFKGYNVTILAYGQTGSGKTHSMGTAYTGQDELGVIPRAIHDIFTFAKDNFSYDFTIKVSFMELYQETLYDLLSGKTKDQCVVEIREDTSKGILMPTLTEQLVLTASEALELLTKGSQGRATSSTNMNAQSSRSHAIYTINICMQTKDNSNLNKTAKFHLVDLAGSERSKKTGATGQTFKEGVNINKGLLALGNIMSALGDEKTQHNYINYRDSNLTRLLKDSLGGNSITLMIACVSPADYNLDETMSTLRYADRAKKIKNKPVVNEDPRTAEVNRLNKLVQQLRLELVGQGGPIICQAELELLKKEVNDLKIKNRHLNITLGTALNDNAILAERVIVIQNSNEDLIKKLHDLKDEYNFTLNNLNLSVEHSDVTAIKDNVVKLQIIGACLTDINSDQIKKNDEIRREEAHSVRNDCADDCNSVHEINERQETHTAQQVELNSELQDVMKKLALKEHLARQIIANTCQIGDYNAIQENEAKITSLQNEKDQLLQQLKNAQTQGVSSKAADQRRKRVQELETQIHDLRKKIVELGRLIKLKEKDEQKVKQLNNEILWMKQMKVQLIKKMREEAERFRTWKLQKERDLHKLKDQDRKRQNQIVKMEMMHSKQQSVLKRKVEEAVANNRRLKEALATRKNARDLKSSGKIERVAQWIQQELEVHVHTLEAQNSLKILLEDRALLHQRLNTLKVDEDADEIQRLRDDIQLRSVQILDLQQKIMDSDEENKAQSRWDNIHGMAEAKRALETLFELVSEIRNKNFASENKTKEHENTNAALTHTQKELMNIIRRKEQEYAHCQQDYEEKIAVLLRLVVPTENAEDENRKVLQMQQNQIGNLEKKNCSLQEKIKEINALANNAKTPQHIDTLRRRRYSPELGITSATFVMSDDEYSDNVDADPDWRNTPLAKRLVKLKHENDINQSNVPLFADNPLKRSSGGGCTCRKGQCSTKMCGCHKTSQACSSMCNCDIEVCANGKSSEENESEQSETGEDIFKKPRELNDEEEIMLPPRSKRRTGKIQF